ncbi:type III pantothenate kinase [Flavobacterium sp. MFBS3-15]|uniref:type III pantothenate kinase n=1 Tax=Flavobacterium sp. MFBS3-15 TaxID=2989816 RepID=UPI0022365231|nr:type III pantothenate kinase [Flavobacterium sp. MFBS3-15]MCW4468691.1 type III pantothenate kinase [Flavobacterium sp. MFBS3-15]
MLLAVDIGNTMIKAAVFEDAVLVEKFVFDKSGAAEEVQNIFEKHPGITHSMLASVGKEEENLFALLKEKTQLLEVGRNFTFPFQNKYGTPETLGIDRMVLAAGAVLKFPGRNRLVIDAGTCVTYDFIDNAGNYLGGAISPGLQMRYNAMHTFTAKLPLLYAEMPESFIGSSTATSMHSGAVYGLLLELDGFIARYVEQYQEVTIIMTGGDADFLAKRLKNTIFANSNFLLESLNLLYLYTNQ